MKLRLIIIFLLFFCSQSLILLGQPTMHVAIFSATDDLYVGKGNRKSVELLDKELNRIKQEAKGSIIVSEEYFVGERCSLAEFNNCVEKLKSIVGLDDIVLFYFMGHGFMSKDISVDTPNLLFANTDGPMNDNFVQNNHLNLREIHDKMKGIGARLTITVGEACNSHIEKVKGSRFIDSLGKVNISPPELIIPERYEELLNKPSGDIMLYSSMKGQSSFVSDLYGGVFTQAFVKALHRTIISPNPARWSDLCTYISVFAYDVCQEAGITEKQTPIEIISIDFDDDYAGEITPMENPEVIIVDIVDKFKGSKELKKEVKKMLKGREASRSVYELLHRVDIAEENTKYQPLSHYIIMGKMGELHDESSNVLLYYSTAREIYKPKEGKTKMSEIDDKVIDMMNNLAKKRRNKSEFAKAIDDAGGVYRWLIERQESLEKSFLEKTAETEEEIEEIKKFIVELDLQILQEMQAIDSIDQQIEYLHSKIVANQDTIKGLNAFKNARVTASIHDIGNVTEQDMNEISEYIDCLQVSERAEDCNASIPTVLSAGYATINFASDSTSNTGSIPYDLKSYPLGKYCTDNIARTTIGITQTMMDALSRVPREEKYMERIKISGVIKGYADYRGAGKLLNIYYSGEEFLLATYQNKYEEIVEVEFSSGVNTRITNEQLAFLRAYCAYQIIKDKISEATGGLLDVDNELVFDIDFEAIEQDKDGKTNTEEFRGVDIKLGVDNLYNWVEDSVNKRRAENRRLINDIKQLEIAKESHVLKIEGLEDRKKKMKLTIKEKREDINEKRKIIVENGYGGSKTKKETDKIK